MNDLFEALEICLQDIEHGADVETVLFRYPDLADELRPILEASAGAKSLAVPAPSVEVVQRNRAKVLGRAAQMREAKARSSQQFWFASLRRVAVTLAMLIVLFVSGTGLVGAASDTLPGDSLYPVKRTWEGVRLFFAFNAHVRETLEFEYENERLRELQELFAEGRSEEVDFRGRVTSQRGGEWVVAGVRVLITADTDIRDSGIVVGSPVRVRGITQGNDTVLAERIRLLDADDVKDDDDSGPGSGIDNSGSDDDHSDSNSGSDDDEDNSGPGSGDDNSGSGNGSEEDETSNSNDRSDDNEDNSGPGSGEGHSGNDDDRDDNDNDDSGGSDDDDD